MLWFLWQRNGAKPSCQMRLQEIYEAHRTNRTAQQKSLMLAPDFPGVSIDDILARVAAQEPNYEDPRNSLVVWTRPSPSVKTLATKIQNRLAAAAPRTRLLLVHTWRH